MAHGILLGSSRWSNESRVGGQRIVAVRETKSEQVDRSVVQADDRRGGSSGPLCDVSTGCSVEGGPDHRTLLQGELGDRNVQCVRTTIVAGALRLGLRGPRGVSALDERQVAAREQRALEEAFQSLARGAARGASRGPRRSPARSAW